jgi:hypothetical protein
MPKKLKVIDSDDGVDSDSDKKKKVKKKTKAKKKTTKKKDKGITINVNVGSSGGNNKKTGKGGKGGFGGGVKNNRGFFSYASKDKNAHKYNTTEPANIKPLAYNQSMVSGHLDKNDAKDIEKIKDKLTKQDNNIIQGVESLKNLQNQLFQIENSPKKEIVYIQSPYNNIPVSAIKERKKPGPKPKNVIIEEVKENRRRGRPRIPEDQKKNKKKKSTTTEPIQNLSVQFEEVKDPVKVYTNPQDEPVSTYSFSENTEPFFQPGDNGDDDNLFNYTADIPEQVKQAQKKQIIKKTTKTFITQQYRKYDKDDPDFDSDWRAYLDDNDIHPDDVEGMTKKQTIDYVYNQINGIRQPTTATAPAPDETSFDYEQTFLEDSDDQVKSTNINPLNNDTGGSYILNNPPENVDALLESIKGFKPLIYDEATNKVTTRSQAKKDEENPIFAEIKKGTKLKKAVTKTKEDKAKEKLKSLPNYGLYTYDEDDNNDNKNDDDIPPINSIPVIKKVSKLKKRSSQNPVVETSSNKDVDMLSSFSSMMNMIPNIKFEGDNNDVEWV